MFPQVLFKMFGRKEKLGMNNYNSWVFSATAVHRQLQFLENALVALPVLRQLEQLRQSSETRSCKHHSTTMKSATQFVCQPAALNEYSSLPY
jgi:hypothetical protein